MLGFDPVTLSAAYILAGMTTASCPQQGPVEVDVQLVTKQAPYVTDMTAVQMNNTFRNDTDTTLFTDGRWLIDGLTRSQIQSQASASFNGVIDTRTGETCFSVKQVTYTIIYSPVIYIASDFQGMACRHAVVLNHEKHHVDTDVRTITDFIPQMRRDIEAYATTLQPQGPYASSDVQRQEQRVIASIGEALKPTLGQLVVLRRQRQAEIDTVANYTRETAMCPGQFPKFDGSRP